MNAGIAAQQQGWCQSLPEFRPAANRGNDAIGSPRRNICSNIGRIDSFGRFLAGDILLQLSFSAQTAEFELLLAFFPPHFVLIVIGQDASGAIAAVGACIVIVIVIVVFVLVVKRE